MIEYGEERDGLIEYGEWQLGNAGTIGRTVTRWFDGPLGRSFGVDWENAPPPMPVSALLYLPTWMKLIQIHAPWFVYPMMRHAHRDALAVAHWLQFYVWLYYASVWWLELNPTPMLVWS